jgi:hypothetical protein
MNKMNCPNKDEASIDAPDDTPPNEQNEGIIQTTPDIEQMREEPDKEMNQEPILCDENTIVEEEYPINTQDSQRYMQWHCT